MELFSGYAAAVVHVLVGQLLVVNQGYAVRPSLSPVDAVGAAAIVHREGVDMGDLGVARVFRRRLRRRCGLGFMDAVCDVGE